MDGFVVGARTDVDDGERWLAMEAVRDHGRPRVDHLSRLRLPAAVGLDEASFLAGSIAHPTLVITGFVDLETHCLIRRWQSSNLARDPASDNPKRPSAPAGSR